MTAVVLGQAAVAGDSLSAPDDTMLTASSTARPRSPAPSWPRPCAAGVPIRR
ncbi:hypothetical protein BJ965_005447 [Streptomyces luteogriseus]|uniref:Uncharacterized protein n=1 Tax=Streptomyces luteogriseus TaxID=68233 RepID=A0A7W7GLD8_9ACTN|nr:hypothetical protein [Streptomyces luteogriseus]MBB4715565.1 hypothetical protein [Streptomyces luteogriseus]